MSGDYEGALEGFTNALALVPEENKAVLYSNIGAACKSIIIFIFIHFFLFQFLIGSKLTYCYGDGDDDGSDSDEFGKDRRCY